MAAELCLRPYQGELVASIRRAWTDGDNRVLAWLPTGGGKTEIAAALALEEEQRGGHTLFVIERKPLCRQAAERFRKYGLLPAILRGEDTHVRGYESVTVGSIQTLKARAGGADVESVLARTTQVIMDEAHILHRHHDELLNRLPHTRALGLTATPLRDGLGLRYHTLVRGPSYGWMIEQGHLVRPRYYLPSQQAVTDGLKSVGVASTGDYQTGELSELMRGKAIIGDLVGTWKLKGENRPTIVFCVDIAHSKAVCDEFQSAGVSAAHIDKATPEDERARIFAAFRAGTIRVLCSVAVLSVGFDEPAAACVILARPTLSLSLHVQQIGRGLRSNPGKSDCLVFDHACNLMRHGKIEDFAPPDLSEIDARSDRKRKTDPVYDCRPCPECSAILEPGQRVCDECGHEIGRKNQVHFVPGELRESHDPQPTTPPDDAIKDFYLQMKSVCHARGWKPGKAYRDTMERFGLSEAEAKARIKWGWKDLPPRPPDDATARWLKSRQIAWAKSRDKAV